MCEKIISTRRSTYQLFNLKPLLMVKNEPCSKLLVYKRNMPCPQLPLSEAIVVLFGNAKCSKPTGHAKQIIMTPNHLRSENVWIWHDTWKKLGWRWGCFLKCLKWIDCSATLCLIEFCRGGHAEHCCRVSDLFLKLKTEGFLTNQMKIFLKYTVY